MSKQLTGQAAPEQIKKWKEENKIDKIFSYEVDGKVCYFKPVDRNTYSLAASKITSAGPAKFNEVVIERVWLGGDDAIRKEDKYFFGLIEHVEAIMDKQKGTLGEL
jgi:hypothetical protein